MDILILLIHAQRACVAFSVFWSHNFCALGEKNQIDTLPEFLFVMGIHDGGKSIITLSPRHWFRDKYLALDMTVIGWQN